jgi:hypothetical protein
MIDVNAILQLAITYENKCSQELVKLAKIRKMPDGSYRVLSQTGKNLGSYKSRKGAERRLRMIEMFKHMKEKE